MKISSFDAYKEAAGGDFCDQSERGTVHADFPHVVCVEMSYPEMDMATRWCWMNFGPRHGKCMETHSDYPGCPFVLASEKIVVHRASATQKEYKEKQYRNPGEHEHVGCWATFWYGKTGYDYDFMDFCFKNEEDAKKFVAVAESFGWGERYEEGGEWCPW